jgi:DNA processing protein
MTPAIFEIIKILKTDAAYPPALLNLSDAPEFFYARGNLDCFNLPAVAMVGTRHASEHGLMASRSFSRSLGLAGVCIVSGLAYGVDAVSHRGALDAKGKTIAVVGSGIDDEALYPRANLRLGQEILKSGGLIISENPAGTKPQPWDFVKRNRLIAALSRATIVVEAPIKSGALITAKYALEMGREVYAVPGDAMRENTKGSNGLIAAGAVPLIEAQELIDIIFPAKKSQKNTAKLDQEFSTEEKLILQKLALGTQHVDDLINASRLSPELMQATLTGLELRGIIASLGNMRYALS